MGHGTVSVVRGKKAGEAARVVSHTRQKKASMGHGTFMCLYLFTFFFDSLELVIFLGPGMKSRRLRG